MVHCNRSFRAHAVRTALLLAVLFLSRPASGATRYVGLTPSGARIEATVIEGASPASPTVLLVGGLNGKDESVRIVEEETRKFATIQSSRRRFRLLAISVANPDGNKLMFPPAGIAYRDNPESHALWRWIAIEAPDFVLIAGMAPYVDGSKDSLAHPTSPGFAGYLIFAELAQRTRNRSYLQLVRRVADLGFTDRGEMKESMPLHDEMSDSVFMGCPILAKAFPALGLSLTRSDFPRSHAEFPGLLLAYQRHLAALSKFQDPEGLWREVVDEPASYPEFSATAMIATAMLIGIRHGWLDSRSFQPRVNKAWEAILRRVGPEGRLMDVCESTGKQKSEADYLRRAAILGQDARGGAMALLFAIQMAGIQ